MITFNIDSSYKSPKLEKLLTKAAQIVLKHQGISKGVEITIAMGGDTKLQKLNRQFRGESKATDVLSFPSDEHDPENEKRYLGDVVISFPRAKAQAKAAGHKTEDELQLLVVHGVLHLLGHDHGDPQERSAMWKAQDEILGDLGLPMRSVQTEDLHSKP